MSFCHKLMLFTSQATTIMIVVIIVRIMLSYTVKHVKTESCRNRSHDLSKHFLCPVMSISNVFICEPDETEYIKKKQYYVPKKFRLVMYHCYNI